MNAPIHPLGQHGLTLLLLIAGPLIEPSRLWAQGDSEDSAGDYSIAGTCTVWRTKELVPDATVHLVRRQGLLGKPEWIASTETDEDGRFEFVAVGSPPSELRLKPVRYTLVCDAKGHPITFQYVYSHSDPGDLRLGVYQEQADLRGRVVDTTGQPVEGALVIPRGAEAAPAIGLGFAITDEQGRFKITRLPEANAKNQLKSGSFQIKSDRFPTVNNARAEVPGDVEFKLDAGCRLTGQVRDKDSSRGVPGVVVTAVPMEAGGVEEQTRTDKDGRYELIVAEANYHIQLEDPALVAPALQDVECRARSIRALDPLVASAGGWLTGRVVHPRTGQPAVWANNRRVSVGVFGPATPKRKIIGGRVLDFVDDDGRFRIRVAAGDNYPYVINAQADRMAWDTDRQAAISVPDRGIARCFIKLKIRRTDAEKMIDANKAVADLPTDKAARSRAIIEEFRKLNHTVDETELWCSLMKALIEIGDEAVPLLCEELDATDQQRMMRRLGYALRALNDPRAVPPLIRAIPKTLQPSMSDYGLIVADADLLAFMQDHDLDEDRRGRHFGFGRPVREIFGALNAITGQQLSEAELYHVHRSKDRRTLYAQQQQYQATAQQWRDWWQQNWQQSGVDAAFSNVALPPLEQLDLSSLPTGLSLSNDAQIDRSSRGLTISPIGDKTGRRFFLDLDTGRSVDWPKSLPRGDQSAENVTKATEWAAEQKVDLVCIQRTDKSGKTPFMLQGLGLQLWEIDPLDAKNISKRIEHGKLPTGRKIDDGRLLHFDPNTKQHVPKIGSSFMYLTREDGLGIITITDAVTQAKDVTGMLQAPQGVGFNLGVRFDLKSVAR